MEQGFRKMTSKWQGCLKVGERGAWAGADHTSETRINVKEKSARKEILDEWVIWYSFVAGQMTVCRANQSVTSPAPQQPETWMPMTASHQDSPSLQRDVAVLKLWSYSSCTWGILNEGFPAASPCMTEPKNSWHNLWCLSQYREVKVKSD